MKKISLIFLVFLFLVPSLILPIYATTNEISVEDMKAELVSQGLFEGYVNSMMDTQVVELYNDIQAGNREIIFIEENAEIDCLRSTTETFALINEDNFSLSIALIPYYNNSNKITKIQSVVVWQWYDAEPAGRRDDLVHLCWDSDRLTLDTSDFSSGDFYTKHSGTYVEYNQSSSPAKATTSDMVVYSNVYSGFGVDRGGWCIFDFLPASPMYKGTNYTTSLVATYYHNKSMVPGINNFTYSVLDTGIRVNFNDLFTDTLSTSGILKYSR